MTKTSLTILWLAAAGLGGSVAWVKMNQSHQAEATTSRARGETLFESFPSAQIARIHIKSAKDKVTLVKGGKGWTVAERDGYPADVKRINELLNDLEDVKITQGIQAGPTYDKRFGMDPVADTPEAHGIQIIFSAANDTQLASVTLGKTLESNSGGLFGMGGGVTGRFIRNRAEPDAVYVTSETFPRIVANPKDWLRDDFIAIEKIKSIAVKMPNKKDFKPWKLVRPDEVSEFKLEGAGKNEKLDAPAITPLKSLFSYARFEDVAPKDAAKQLNKSPDLRVVTIDTVEGFTYTIRFAPKKAGGKKDAKPGAAAPRNYLLTVQVKANIPKQRKKAKDEKKEDAKKLDESFAKRTKELTGKLEKEKQLEGYVFEVTRWTVEALLKNRAQLVAKTTQPVTTPGAPRQPQPGRPGMPPQTPKHRIEAVTPPVAIPPLRTDNKPKPGTDKPQPKKKPVAKPTPQPAPAKPAAKPKPQPAPVKPAAKPKPQPAPAKPKPQPTPAKPAPAKPKPQPAPAKPAPAKPKPQSAPAKPTPPKQENPPAKQAAPKKNPSPEKNPAPKPPADPAKTPAPAAN